MHERDVTMKQHQLLVLTPLTLIFLFLHRLQEEVDKLNEDHGAEEALQRKKRTKIEFEVFTQIQTYDERMGKRQAEVGLHLSVSPPISTSFSLHPFLSCRIATPDHRPVPTTPSSSRCRQNTTQTSVSSRSLRSTLPRWTRPQDESRRRKRASKRRGRERQRS